MSRIGGLRQRRSCSGSMDLAREKHIDEFENLVGEYKAQIRALATDI